MMDTSLQREPLHPCGWAFKCSQVLTLDGIFHFYVREINTAVLNMVFHQITKFILADGINLSAVRQVPVAVGRSERALLSEMDLNYNTSINKRTKKAPAKVMMVMPPAPELAKCPSGKLKDPSPV